jgi:hypothetical protein
MNALQVVKMLIAFSQTVSRTLTILTVRNLIWEARKQFTILLQHTKMLPDSAIPTPVLTKTGRVPTRVPPFSTTRPSPIVLSRSRGCHANPSR